MDKQQWNKLGITTSRLGFGCMRFPLTADGKIDRVISTRMLDEAYAAGVTYYDTAYVYHNGESERFVGEWLDKHPRDSYYLATKLPVWEVKTLADATRIFEEQLSKLHKDRIDFFLLHALNKGSFKKVLDLDLIGFGEELKAAGKIKYLGFSFHDDYEVFEEIARAHAWDFCQIQLNYMDTDEQAGLKGYRLTEELGIPLVIMEPIKGGSLAILPDEITGPLKQISPNATKANWALRWVGSLKNVHVILSGMSTPEQVTDNLATFNNMAPLTAAEQAAVEEVAASIRARVKNGCTGCAYCMPCPNGVDIPRNFAAWNSWGMYQNVGEANWLWKATMPDDARAKNCIECGECEEKCPQHLSIREDLAALQIELDKVTA